MTARLQISNVDGSGRILHLIHILHLPHKCWAIRELHCLSQNRCLVAGDRNPDSVMRIPVRFALNLSFRSRQRSGNPAPPRIFHPDDSDSYPVLESGADSSGLGPFVRSLHRIFIKFKAVTAVTEFEIPIQYISS